ncbi:MAG: hypothetical protein GEV11_15445 [Streptosporangiales bacterium]|nr:hypothetical protein [Streptosporangiales bacterium]
MSYPRLHRAGDPRGRRGPRTSPAAVAGLVILAALTGAALVGGAFRLLAGDPGGDPPPPAEPPSALTERSAETSRDRPPPQRTLLPEGSDGRVTGHVDGDTLRVDGRAVDLIGVDADSGACGGAARRLIEKELPVGEWVRLEYDERVTGADGQALAYVHRYSDGRFLNERLLIRGLVRAREREPNVRHALGFSVAEGKARLDRTGLWGGGCRGR